MWMWSITLPPPSVSASRCMRSRATWRSTPRGRPTFCRRCWNGDGRLEKLIVASSMSIYGEGSVPLRTARHGGAATASGGAVAGTSSGRWRVRNAGSALEPAATAEGKPLQCSSIYALSKKDQEEMGLLFGRTYGVPVVALRYFNIYGTRQALSNPYTGVAAIFASRLLNRRAPLIFEDGEQLRDFVSVHDVVQANLLAMQRSEADGLALNIGSGRAGYDSSGGRNSGCHAGSADAGGDYRQVSRRRHSALLWRHLAGAAACWATVRASSSKARWESWWSGCARRVRWIWSRRHRAVWWPLA